MKNLIKYTVGLPILLLISISIVCFYTLLSILSFLSEIIGYCIDGTSNFGNLFWWVEDVKDIWRPIK